MTTTVLRDGPRFYRLSGEPFIPVEFADAAYRYGHSQIKATINCERWRALSVFPTWRVSCR